MSITSRCDICKRTEFDMPILSPINHYKLKRLGHYGWERIDICGDCEREIRLKVRKNSEEE